MKKLKLQSKVKVKVDEKEYGKGYDPVNKLTKWKNRIIENICYYFTCLKKGKETDYMASRKLYEHYANSSETDLLNDPFDQVLDKEDIIY